MNETLYEFSNITAPINISDNAFYLLLTFAPIYLLAIYGYVWISSLLFISLVSLTFIILHILYRGSNIIYFRDSDAFLIPIVTLILPAFLFGPTIVLLIVAFFCYILRDKKTVNEKDGSRLIAY